MKWVQGDLRFCEPVTATPTSSVHIRVIGATGPHTGGGIDTPTLCGKEFSGWDLNAEVEVQPVRGWLASDVERAADGHPVGPLCLPCAGIFLDAAKNHARW